jgi:glycosyl transferase family 25
MKPAFRIISLPGSDERRRAMARQMEQIGADWQFFDARRDAPEGLSYRPQMARWMRGRELTPGELGCFASHVAIWRGLLETPGLDGLCVFEDDLLIDPTFFGRMAEFVRECPLGYVRFYGKLPVPTTRICDTIGRRQIVYFERPVYGTQAYWITRPMAERFLASISEVVRPIDDEMDRCWAHGVPSAGVFPYPVIEVDFGSTIEGARRSLPALSPGDALHRQYHRAIEKVRRVSHYGRVATLGRRPVGPLLPAPLEVST